MDTFREFVRNNEKWFRGALPESNDSLNEAEEDLGVKLPPDLRWLMKEYCCGIATGISGIEDTVDLTKQAREHLRLPRNYLVLCDNQDGGIILLDTAEVDGQYRVIDAGWESIPDHLDEEILHPDLLSYTKSVMRMHRDLSDIDDEE